MPSRMRGAALLASDCVAGLNERAVNEASRAASSTWHERPAAAAAVAVCERTAAAMLVNGERPPQMAGMNRPTLVIINAT